MSEEELFKKIYNINSNDITIDTFIKSIILYDLYQTTDYILWIGGSRAWNNFYIKKTDDINFLILNVGMNNIIYPRRRERV